jgi:hypothetical protein
MPRNAGGACYHIFYMDFSYLKSPGSIPKEKLAKGVFIGFAVIIILAFLFGGRDSHRVFPMMAGGTGGFNVVAMDAVGVAPGMPTAYGGRLMAQKSMAYESYGDGDASISYPAPMPPTYEETAGSPDFPAERKVIRNGSLGLVVNDVAKTTKDLGDLAARMNGWIENQNMYEYMAGSLQGDLTIRVPEGKFMETLAQAKLLAVRVQNEQIGSNDVSAQVVDLEARIKNKRAEEASYTAILKTAVKVSDVLEVTRMLSSVRGEIERMEGQINYLSRQTSMSTIHVSLTPVANAKEVTNEWKPLLVIKESFKNLAVALTRFVDGIIMFFIQVLPVLILQLGLIFLIGMVVWKAGKKLFRHLGGTTLPPKAG